MFKRWGAALAAGFVALSGSVALTPRSAAAYVPHATLVPETPALGFPKILYTPTFVDNGTTTRRQVWATDQVGRYIVAGGDFWNVELQDGTVIDQKYFTAFNIDTKQIVCQGQLTFDNDVLDVAAGPTDTTVYVAGRFSKITGADGVPRTRIRVGLVDLANCSVDTTFVSIGANGRISEIARTGNRLFVGGDFTAIGGVAVETVAELNATTGTVNPLFNFPTSGELTSRVRGLDVSPDGSRLLLGGRFGTISGSGRNIPNPTAVFDISNAAAPVLTAHQSSGYVTVADLQDVATSPEGDAFALVYGTNTNSDYVYYTPAVESSTSYAWRHYMRDSLFGVAITNNAVYVGGHFCKPDSGPGASEVMSPKMGFDSCTGTNTAGGVWRSHLAALSRTDGTPLTWNPGQDSFVGARRLTATTRGLLIGFDGERVNDIRTGALAFLDFGPAVEDVTPPSDVTITAPTPGASVDNPATLSGFATDNFAINRFELSLQASNGQYLQADGTLGTAFANFTANAAPDNSFSIQRTMPAQTYTLSAKAVDGAGYKSANSTTVTFVQTGIEHNAPTLTLSVPAAAVIVGSQPAITGTAIDDTAVQSLSVRVTDIAGLYLQNNGTFAATVNDYPFTVTSGALGTTSLAWSIAVGTGLPAGNYAVAVNAADPSANAASASGAFTMQVLQPRPAITSLTGFDTRNGTYTMGFQFTVSAPITVSRLGAFDTNNNGVLNNAGNTGVGLWRSNGQLLGSVSVPNNTPVDNRWFYANLAAPITLTPGTTYVLGQQTFSNGEPYARNGTATTDPLVSIVRRTYGISLFGGLVFPSITTGNVGIGAPNLKFLPV